MIVLLAPPPGPAYNFIVSLYTYPGAWINSFVAGGLIYLHHSKREKWESGWYTHIPIIVIFLLSNIFLVLVPFIPPDGDWNTEGYPYYVFPVVGVAVLLFGAFYWAIWTKVWPWARGHKIISDRVIDEHGVEVIRYRKVKTT